GIAALGATQSGRAEAVEREFLKTPDLRRRGLDALVSLAGGAEEHQKNPTTKHQRPGLGLGDENECVVARIGACGMVRDPGRVGSSWELRKVVSRRVHIPTEVLVSRRGQVCRVVSPAVQIRLLIDLIW